MAFIEAEGQIGESDLAALLRTRPAHEIMLALEQTQTVRGVMACLRAEQAGKARRRILRRCERRIAQLSGQQASGVSHLYAVGRAVDPDELAFESRITMAKKPTGKIVAGVGTAVGRKGSAAATVIQDAMAAAVRECYKRGVTDPDVIREAQLKARENAKALIDDAARKTVQ